MTSVAHNVPANLESGGVNVAPGPEDDGWQMPPPVVLGDGTLVQLLKDGEALRAAYEAVAAARRLICVEAYIFSSDATGRAFADLLCRKATQGVRVYLIYDSFGCLGTDRSMFQRMRRSGVRAEEFHPVRPWECRYSWRPFNRDHRKLVFVDEEFGWLGGMNIADEYGGPWIAGAETLRKVAPWRDTAVGLRGPAARHLARAFAQTWSYVQHSGRIGQCQYFHDGEHYDIVASTAAMRSPVRERFGAIVAAARKSIDLTFAYFAPDDGMVEALCRAARRGVRVRLMVPARSDFPLLVHAARGFYAGLMSAGVEISEREHAILHSKTMVVDEAVSVVGSTNLDYRSIEYNCEISVVLRSPEFGEKMTRLFENDMRYARTICQDNWRRRPVQDRFVQWAVKRMRYLL
jgi:cardiolipin synthase